MNELLKHTKESPSQKALRLFKTSENQSVITQYLSAYIQKQELTQYVDCQWQDYVDSQMHLCESMLANDIIKDNASVEHIILALNKSIVNAVIKRIHHEVYKAANGINQNALLQRSVTVVESDPNEASGAVVDNESSIVYNEELLPLKHINGNRYILQSNNSIVSINAVLISDIEEQEDEPLMVSLHGQNKTIKGQSLQFLNDMLYQNYHVMIIYLDTIKSYAFVQVGSKKHVGSFKVTFNESLCKITGFQVEQIYEIGAISNQRMKTQAKNVRLSFRKVDDDISLGTRLCQIEETGKIVPFFNIVHTNRTNQVIVNIDTAFGEEEIKLLILTAQSCDNDEDDDSN